MKSVLEMVFKTAEDKSHRLTLNDPKEDLTGEEVKEVMDFIVDNDIFNIGGGLVEAVSSAIIVTEKTPIDIG